MSETMNPNRKPRVVRLEEESWIEAPGHHSALSTLLINPENSDTEEFDFRISTYAPKGHVEPHSHEITEHVYYILHGHGLMTLGDDRVLVGPHTAIFIPPPTIHGIENTGLEDLVFVVVSTPASEMSRTDTRASR